MSGEPYIDVEQEDGTLMKITWKAFLGVCEHGSETLIGMPD
ncbi:MAG: hypothetical protein ABSH20_32165 [Tepidisphaeraceae bacterium]